MDIRENISDFEEVIRAAVAGLMKNYWHAMPGQVTQDTADGHVTSVQPTIQRTVTNTDGSLTYEDHQVHPDVPIHHMGGGGVSVTHPNKQGDTGAIIYASRSIDSWFQSDGSQQPMDDRMHSQSDGFFLSGIRSIPRMLKQVSKDSSQVRSDDKKLVIDHHPTDGTKIKSADPSTAAASDSFDPFTQATKFFDHAVHPTQGHMATATDGATVHSTSLDHDNGFKAQAANGAHTVTAHPTDGTGVSSTVAHTISAPNASLDKQGNLTNQGTHAAQGAITSATSMGAPSGNFASGSIGGVGFGGSNPILSMLGGALQIATAVMAAAGISSAPGQPIISGGDVEAQGTVQGGTLRSTTDYTVATLPTPSLAIRGTRAHVTDANGPTFLQPLVGGGAVVCPAFCDGVLWVAA